MVGAFTVATLGLALCATTACGGIAPASERSPEGGSGAGGAHDGSGEPAGTSGTVGGAGAVAGSGSIETGGGAGEPDPIECGVAPPSICHQAAEPGDCLALIPRFYFDSDAGTCEAFTYGGCGGNENNFETQDACYDTCESFADGSQDPSAEECAQECVFEKLVEGAPCPRLGLTCAPHLQCSLDNCVCAPEGSRLGWYCLATMC